VNWFQILFLSAVQGLTEFLPISSSGHLVLFQQLFGLSQPMIFFDVLLHIGTLFAIFFYFRQDLLKLLNGILKKEKSSLKILWLLILGSLPAAAFGFLFEKQINDVFNSLILLGISFLLTGLLLFSTIFIKDSKNIDIAKGKWFDAILIGFFQAIAILPAISRSGSTIVSGLWRGFSKEEAFRFSFFLAIPAILGALLLETKSATQFSSLQLFQGLIGMVVAGVVGYLSLALLQRVLKSKKIWIFGIYCSILGLIILLFNL